jgi:hypothetical protein
MGAQPRHQKSRAGRRYPYFGRDKAILQQREKIKRKTLEARRMIRPTR